MFSFIKDIFSQKLSVDDRYDYELLDIDYIGKTFFLRVPHILFWVQLLVILIISISVFAVLATIIYTQIIPHRHSSYSNIIGYGVVIPICIYFPFVFMDFLNVRNKLLRFGFTMAPMLGIFRTMEAIHGFSPGSSESSLKSYIAYFVTLGEVLYDRETKQPIEPTTDGIIKKHILFLSSVILSGLFASFSHHFDYKFFDIGTEDLNSFKVSPLILLNIRHILNNFFITLLVQLYIVTLTLPLGIIANLFMNVEVIDIMQNALFSCSSVADFWGKKWNLVLHGVLKRGVFKPVRTHTSTIVAMVFTFIASGLFHEWIVAVFLYDEQCSKCFYPRTFGSQMMFFLWNAMTLAIEYTLGKSFSVSRITGISLPQQLQTFLILSTALPIAHWFLNDYIESGWFHDAIIGFPTLIIKNSK